MPMNPTLNQKTSGIKIFLRILVFIIILAGPIWLGFRNTRAISEGPSLTILNPTIGDVITKPTITIRGTVERAIELRINNILYPISLDGKFITRTAITPGLSTIHISAVDRFGNETTVDLPVYSRYEGTPIFEIKPKIIAQEPIIDSTTNLRNPISEDTTNTSLNHSPNDTTFDTPDPLPANENDDTIETSTIR